MNKRPSQCPAKEPVPNDLEDSSGTISTHVSDADVNDEIQVTRPPIVICEDDAGHPNQHAKETHFHTSCIRDSIQVRKHHKVNDHELHEENPHLEDYLIPHHSVHIERPGEADDVTVTCEETTTEKDSCTQEAADKEVATKKICCTEGIFHTEVTVPNSQEQEKTKRKVHFGWSWTMPWF